MTKVLLICGGRHYQAQPKDFDFLMDFIYTNEVTKIIQGGAKGADRIGKDLAESSWGYQIVDHEEFPADWEQYGKAGGMVRNAEMADVADLCVAFPGGKGTKDMMARCHKKHIPVIEPYREEIDSLHAFFD